MAYYTLLTKEDNSKWYPQFGDYDRQTVMEEVTEYVSEYGRKNIKVVKAIDDSINSLKMAMMQANLEFDL